MSKFSGRFDFYDLIVLHGFDYVQHSRVYTVGGFDQQTGKVIPEKRLEFESLKDAVPYYPYIITMSSTGKDAGTIYLSAKSWVDIEEERYGHFAAHDRYRRELQEELGRWSDG